ncbi:MAG: sel1 repeat family protein [Gammaproteobacteria bacterium]|nr:sel1 repeat family protein [Gammaproteobacteria bacterium]NNC56517.1 sel1 repeat family protein [Woeseiaceae bacterium]NNL49849.1 sel1 repeat family protein [Woeseiaceae bacterium]
MRTFPRTFLALLLCLLAPAAWAGDFQKGWGAYSSTDYATALNEWQELADSGDADACYGMGLLYGNGFGVDMNDDLALKYYGIAADLGHAEAQYSLGVMFQNGWGVPVDEEEGVKWYRLAAEQGIVGAYLALGRVNALDYAESYDPVQAHKWFTLAANAGDLDAKTKLEFLETRMTPEQVVEAKALASAWMQSH